MTFATGRALTGPADYGYSEAVLSSRNKIAELGSSAQCLLSGRESTLHPKFFLATISDKVWIPRVVVIRQAGELLGIVYTKERRVAGLPTGIIYGDSTLGGMVVAEPIHQGFVLTAAVNALLAAPRTRGLRILAPPDGFELNTIKTALRPGKFDICEACVQNHVGLALPSGYDEFIDFFGPRTRRNLRYYRNRSECAKNVYAENIPLPEFKSATYSLLKEGVVGADIDGINRALNMFSATNRPFLAGLRGTDGEWLSILGGWYESNRMIVFLQMNSDRKHPRDSLSLVMRSYVVESMIAKRIQTVLFWAGVGGPIGQRAKPLPTVALHIDSRSPVWRALRRTISSVSPKLPARMAFMAGWVTSPTTTTAQGSELATSD
jgi:hypothetical protein